MPGFLNEQYESLEFIPTPTFIDPVSKFRVSQPENLIDTDFEYGLQETRWETLERVNNIPTFFARPGDNPIPVSDVEAVVGSARIFVTTSSAHGLVTGSPIIIQGLESFSAEGAFVVDSVPSTTEFSYECKDIQTKDGFGSGTIFTIFKEDETVAYIGRLYQGTQSKLDTLEAITTDGKDPSVLTITTPSAHGFSEGTKFILSNSVGGKTYKFDATLIDPRNIVELSTPQSRMSRQNVPVTGQDPLETYDKVSFQWYDWMPKYMVSFSQQNINIFDNSIYVPNHPFNTGDAVMYFPPADTLAQNGSTSSITGTQFSPIAAYNTVYHVVVLDPNRIQLTTTELFPQSTSPAIVDLADFGTTNYGYHVLGKVYRVESVALNDVITLRRSLVDTDPTAGQECYVFSTSTGISATTSTRSLYNYRVQDQLTAPWYKFYMQEDSSNSSAGYSVLRVTGNNINVTSNVLTPNTAYEAIIPAAVGVRQKINDGTLADFTTGDEVVVYRRFGDIPGGLADGSRYWIRITSSTTFTLHTSRANAQSGAGIVDITSQGSGTNTYIFLEKQNRYIKLFTNTALTNVVDINSVTITGTVWIVPGTTLADDSTASGSFEDINQGDVVVIDEQRLINGSSVSESYYPTDIPVNNNTDNFVPIRQFVSPTADQITIASGTLDGVHNGTEFKYTLLPGTATVDIRAGVNTTSEVLTSLTDTWPFWIRSLKTGDRVRVNIEESGQYFNVASINATTDQVTVPSTANWSNGTAVIFYITSDLATPPEFTSAVYTVTPTTWATTGVKGYVRVLTATTIEVYDTRAAAIAGTVGNRWNFGRSGNGIGRISAKDIENLPTGITEDQILNVRVTGAQTFTLHSSKSDAENNTGIVNLSTNYGGYVKFTQILDADSNSIEGLYYGEQARATVTQNSVNVNTSTDVITTDAPHGFYTGDGVRYTSSSVIGGLSLGAEYWVNVISSVQFTLHPSRDNAIANTSIIDLTGTPTGTGLFVDSRGVNFDQNATYINITTDQITFRFNHPYVTGDCVIYINGGTLPTGLSSPTQYFIRSISPTVVSLHTTKAGAIANTGRVDITAVGAGFGGFRKVSLLPKDVSYFMRKDAATVFKLFRTAQEAIWNYNAIDIAFEPQSNSLGFGPGSGYAVFSMVQPFMGISVNTVATNILNTDNSRNFKTGEQVTYELYQGQTKQTGLTVGNKYFIRVLSATTCALYPSFNDALRDTSANRVKLINATGTGYLKGTNLPVGIGDGVNTLVEKSGPLSVRFKEDLVSGRTVRILPAVGTRFGLMSLTKRDPVATSNTFYVPQHGLTENTTLIYNSGQNVAIPSTPQLANNTTYYVSSPTQDRFRLSTTTDVMIKTITASGLTVDQVGYFFTSATLGSNITIAQNATNFNTTTNIITAPSAHGYVNGDAVVYFNLTDPAAPFVNGTRYYARSVSSLTFSLHPTKADAINNTNIIDITTSGSGNAVFSKDNFATGDKVVISLSNPITGIQSGSMYYIGSMTENTFALFYTSADAANVQVNTTGQTPNDLRVPILSFIGGTTITFRMKQYIDLNTVGVGIQELSNIAQNAVDGVYTLDTINGGQGSTSFSLSPSDAILSPRQLTFNPYKEFSSETNAFKYGDHKLYTGAEIIYNESLPVELIQNSTNINHTTNTITINSHGLTDGQQIQYVLESGAVPYGLTNNGYYFANVLNANEFQLAPTEADAIAGTNIVNILRGDGVLDTPYSLDSIVGTVNGIHKGKTSGKIYLYGNLTQVNGQSVTNVVRLNTNGTIDTTFAIPSPGFGGPVSALCESVTGSVYAAGQFLGVGGQARAGIVKLDSTGSVDLTFDPGDGFSIKTINDIAEQSDGKIIVVGSFSDYRGASYNGIVRINASNATNDTSFVVGTGFNAAAYSVQIDSSDNVYVAGAFTQYNGSGNYANKITKLDSTGSVVTSFIQSTQMLASENIFDMVLVPNAESTQFNQDTLLIAGDFTSYDGSTYNNVLRLTLSGAVVAGWTNTGGAGINSSANAVAQYGDRIIVGGTFSSWDGNSVGRIVRLTELGVVDPDFVSGSGFNNPVTGLLAFDSDSLLASGTFSTYNGVAADKVAKIDNPTQPYTGVANFLATSALIPSTNLVNNTSYYVIRVSKDWFKVATTKENALQGVAIDVGGNLAGAGTLGDDANHSFTTYNIGAEVLGPGTIATTNGSKILTGTGTNFLNLFKTGDIFKVFVTRANTSITVSQTVSALNRQISVAQSTAFNTTTDVITSAAHSYITGDYVVYTASPAAGGLTSGNGYYVRVLSTTTFTLHPTKADAVANTNIVNITSAPVATATFTQQDQFFSVGHGLYDGQTVVYTTTNPITNLVNEYSYYAGVISTNAFTLYEHYDHADAANGSIVGDQISLSTTTGNATFTTAYTGSMFTSRVSGVKSTTGIIVDDAVGAFAEDGITPLSTASGLSYALVTSLFVKADGFALHRPFDGGVELTPSLNPDSSVVRQTRKYFRYQSGKGLQVSFGINFNAPTLINSYEVNKNTGIATVATRYSNRITENLVLDFANSQDELLGLNRTFIQNSSTLSGVNSTINLSGQQNFVSGQKVKYSSLSPLTFLDNNEFYYIGLPDPINTPSIVELYTSMDAALARTLSGKVIFTTIPTTSTSGQLIPQNSWVGEYEVTNVIDDKTFNIKLDGVPPSDFAQGFSQYTPVEYDNSLLRCGLFDDQNGMFFEYDGKDLYACRRSSTEQISGSVSAEFNSGEILGSGTLFLSQLEVGDYIVIRGQSYKISHIASNTSLAIQPAYRGVSKTGIIVTKTVDTKVPQSEWSLDRADGKGPSGFNLDLTKMQMAYIDYSWYGAGKVRFGFKGTFGDVVYMHEFVHNNRFTEAYMRSGNLPARYEVLNLSSPTYSPVIAHWGTSVIMDGQFQEDGSYQFTGAGNTIGYTNTAEQQTFLGQITSTSAQRFEFDATTGTNILTYVVRAASFDAVRNIRNGTAITGPQLQAGTYVVSVQNAGGNQANVNVSKQPTGTTGTNQTYNVGPAADPIPALFPLVSVRLGPAVDNSLVGVVGSREIINRMQLNLQSAGIITTHDVEINVILNGNIDNLDFVNLPKPSLSQFLAHAKGDVISGGVQVYTFRVSGASTTTASIARNENIDISGLLELGNSIMGGDGIYPDGPDILTVAARIIDTSSITTTTPLRIAARVSWSESQA